MANCEITCLQFHGCQEVLIERFGTAKTSSKYRNAIAVLRLMLSRKRRSGKLTADKKQRKMTLIICCHGMHRIMLINAGIAKKAVDI
jgi:hypothetical protein